MLTNAVAKAAGAQARAYKLFDGGGLYLHVAASGTKTWRIKYRLSGREQLLTVGRFPDLSIAEARARLAMCKDALHAGRDPADSADHISTFADLARAWHAHHRASWSPVHAADVIASLERDVFPHVGDRPAGSIAAPDLLEAMRAIEARGCTETARRVRQRLSAIFGFGIAQGLVPADPAAQLGRAMMRSDPARPMPALTDIDQCRALLTACDAVPAAQGVRLAGRFLALTAVRLAAVRGMRWSEVDFDAMVWRIPAARMKLAKAKKDDARFDHVVPLSQAALKVLWDAVEPAGMTPQAALAQATARDLLVFPGRTPISPFGENALRDLYARAGYAGRHVPHGWRASFSTILNEQLGEEWRGDIDRALAHAGMGKVEAAYNRAAQLDRRRTLYERWGEMLS